MPYLINAAESRSGSMASGDGPPSPKRAKLDLEGATFVYDPKELADFCLETADGKRIGGECCWQADGVAGGPLRLLA